MRSELIAHLDCQFRRGPSDAHAEEESEIHVLGACICLVMTRDVLRFALVTSDSFQAKSTSVQVLSDPV